MSPSAIFWTAPNEVQHQSFSPREPGPGEVLVEVAYSLVSPGTEREWLSSDSMHASVLGTTFPFVPGYSAAGRVVETGEGVEQLSVGDAVVAGVTGGPVTECHASHVVAPAVAVFPIPDNVRLKDAVFFNLGMTAAHTVRLSGVQKNDSLTVVGQGPIGTMAAQVAQARGASPVVALDLLPERRALSESLGVSYAVDPSDEAALQAVMTSVGGGTTASIDLSGAVAGINLALQTTAPLGTVVLSTALNQHEIQADYDAIFFKGLVVKGAFVLARPSESRDDTTYFLELLSDGSVTSIVHDDEVFSPGDAASVYRRVLEGDRSLTAPVFAWNPELEATR